MSNNVSNTFENGIATIAMDQCKANPVSHQKRDQLQEAFNQAETDNAIVIFKGRPGLFSGGFDLKEISKGPEKALLLTSRGSKMARRILSFPFPVIGVSTGHCIAMGAFLILSCDYRIGAKGEF